MTEKSKEFVDFNELYSTFTYEQLLVEIQELTKQSGILRSSIDRITNHPTMSSDSRYEQCLKLTRKKQYVNAKLLAAQRAYNTLKFKEKLLNKRKGEQEAKAGLFRKAALEVLPHDIYCQVVARYKELKETSAKLAEWRKEPTNE